MAKAKQEPMDAEEKKRMSVAETLEEHKELFKKLAKV